jgi:DNA-binding MarR family transcriptional regulator
MRRSFDAMRRILDRAIDRQLLEAGLSSADYDLLVPLSETPTHELRTRDLGRLVGWDRSRLSHHLRRMEQQGLISRHDCDDDARGTMITLTGEGLRAVKAAAPDTWMSCDAVSWTCSVPPSVNC